MNANAVLTTISAAIAARFPPMVQIALLPYRHWYGPNLPYLETYNRPNTERLESCQADRTYLVRRRRGC